MTEELSPASHGIKLNKLQQKAYDAVINRKNTFITGAGGCGKSVIIKKLKQDLEHKFFRRVAITSTTGVSSRIIGGQTLHSFLGIQLGTKTAEALYTMLIKNYFLLNRWRKMEVLVIDEVSMLSVELFEKIDQLAKLLRRNKKPFGGIQLVLCGDFAQLPAIGSDYFLFESEIWDKCINETIYLVDVMRQTDESFVNVLNKVRLGNIDESCRKVLESRNIKYLVKTALIPTMLYSTNVKVDVTNKIYYDKLMSDEHHYNIDIIWNKKITYKEKYESLIRFKSIISLKIGAQVMYLINKNDLVNGSRGVVTNFVNGMPVVLFAEGFELVVGPEVLNIQEQEEEIMSYSQLPLTLAWATSIHKSQGSTLSLVRIDFRNIFEWGQAYVALSRVKSLDGLYIRNLDFNVIKCHPKAVEYYEEMISNKEAEELVVLESNNKD